MPVHTALLTINCIASNTQTCFENDGLRRKNVPLPYLRCLYVCLFWQATFQIRQTSISECDMQCFRCCDTVPTLNTAITNSIDNEPCVIFALSDLMGKQSNQSDFFFQIIPTSPGDNQIEFIEAGLDNVIVRTQLHQEDSRDRGCFDNGECWFRISLYDMYDPGAVRYCDPFYWHGLTLIPAWMSNYIHYKMWDEITYPFLNFNGCTVEFRNG